MVSSKQTLIAATLMLQSHAQKADRPMNSFPLGNLEGPSCRRICPDYDPVHVVLMTDPYMGCATYPSACQAISCNGVDEKVLKPGRCPIPGEYTDGCVYDTEWAPVCGPDGRTTYSNAAEAACHQIYDVTRGECGEWVTVPVGPAPLLPGTYVDGCVHILTHDPVCGSNGVTYSNSGEAACYSVTEYEAGPCMRGTAKAPKRGKAPKRVRGPKKNDPKPAAVPTPEFNSDVCPDVYQPVFAIDYTHPRLECHQFDNDCEAHCAGIPEADKRFPDRKDLQFWVEDGYCPQPGEYIPGCTWLVPLFDFVCGSNGVTYQNPSEAACNGIFDYTPGFCDDDVPAPAPTDIGVPIELL